MIKMLFQVYFIRYLTHDGYNCFSTFVCLAPISERLMNSLLEVVTQKLCSGNILLSTKAISFDHLPKQKFSLS